MPGVAHRVPQDQRNQEDAESVVPVKQLEAIILDALVSVGPGAPANGARNHHEQCNSQTVGCEHRFSLTFCWSVNPVARIYLPRILETKRSRKRSASTSTHTFALGSTLSRPS